MGRRLNDLFQGYSPYGQDRLGKTYEVLVTETSHDGRFYVGHNEFYEQVLVPKDPDLMGKLVRVEILETCKFSMTGRLIEDEGPSKSPGLASPLDHGQVSGMSTEDSKSFEVVDQKSPASDWVYWASVIILGLAISVRAFQVLFVATMKSTKSSGDDEDVISD